jgi:hypothetical protein
MRSPGQGPATTAQAHRAPASQSQRAHHKPAGDPSSNIVVRIDGAGRRRLVEEVASTNARANGANGDTGLSQVEAQRGQPSRAPRRGLGATWSPLSAALSADMPSVLDCCRAHNPTPRHGRVGGILSTVGYLLDRRQARSSPREQAPFRIRPRRRGASRR